MSSSPDAKSPWMNTASVAELLDKPSREAVRKWARRHGVVPRRCGRLLLYARRDVEAALCPVVNRQVVVKHARRIA